MQQWGHTSQLLQGDALHEQEPMLSRKICHALYFPDACQLDDTYQVCLRLFDFFQLSGGKFKQSEVHQVKAEGEAVVIHTENLHIEFDLAVISAGAWSKQLTLRLGLKIPLAAELVYRNQQQKWHK